MSPQRGTVRPTKQSQTKQGSLNKQLANTKMCVYFQQQGTCKYGAKCVFAHEQGDIAPMPDLKYTRICANYEAGKCLVENCPFAHSFDELRSTDFYYKTTLCTWYAAGKCRNGGQCRFAHGESELRATEGEPAPITKDGSKRQTTEQSVATKKAAKVSNTEQPSKPSKRGQKGSTGKEAKESSKRRDKQKASIQSQVSGIQDTEPQPMFIQPNSALLQSPIPSFIPPTTRLLEYQPIPRMATNVPTYQLPPPQASFPPYAATAGYPEACYPAASQIPVVANSGNAGQPVQDIAALSASIMSLSGQIRQLQQYITPAASKMEAKAGGQSDSTNSGSNNNSESYSQSQSSGDSSPPSTPPLQRDAFSRSDVDRLKLEQLKWQLHLEALAQGIMLDHRHLPPQMQAHCL